MTVNGKMQDSTEGAATVETGGVDFKNSKITGGSASDISVEAGMFQFYGGSIDAGNLSAKSESAVFAVALDQYPLDYVKLKSISAESGSWVLIQKANAVEVTGNISANGASVSFISCGTVPVGGIVTITNSGSSVGNVHVEGGELDVLSTGKILVGDYYGTSASLGASAPISVANGGKITFAAGASAYTTADDNNVVNTVDAADASSSIEIAAGAGLYVENAKADGKTVYDFSKATTKDGAGTGWAGAIYGDSQRVVMDKTTGIYKQQTTEETYPDSTTPSTTEEAIKTGATAAEFIAAVEAANQSGNIAADNAGVTEALNSAAGLTGFSGVGYSMTGFTQDFLSLIHQHKVSADSLWASYLHDKRTADGLKVGNLAANYKVSYDGIVIGSDFMKTDKIQLGAAFAYADGSTSTRSGIYTRNDADYYGGSIYGVMEGGAGMIYRAEIGFGRSSNEMKQYNTGTLITGKTHADAFHIGVTAEKEIETETGIWTPFIGLGFTNVSVDDYTDSLGFRHGSDSAGVWNMPIGISYHFKNDSEGWSVSPVATVGYRFAFGDKDLGETVAYGNGIDHFSTDIAENVFFARLGVEAAKAAVSFGIHYGYEKGSDTKSNAWGVNIAYRF